jgi:hypothetical protein
MVMAQGLDESAKPSGLLEDVRIKTMKRAMPSAADRQGSALTRLANTANTRYSGAQAMNLNR